MVPQVILFCFAFTWSSVPSLDQSLTLELGNGFFRVSMRTSSPLSYKCEEIWKGEDYIFVTVTISNTVFFNTVIQTDVEILFLCCTKWKEKRENLCQQPSFLSVSFPLILTLLYLSSLFPLKFVLLLC